MLAVQSWQRAELYALGLRNKMYSKQTDKPFANWINQKDTIWQKKEVVICDVSFQGFKK